VYDIVGKRNLWFAISAILTLPGLLFIIIGGLKPSIDFTGGTEWEVRYADRPTAEEMTGALAELGHPDALVVALDDGFLRIRTEPIDLIPAATPVPTPTTTPSPTETAAPTGTTSATGTPDPSASPAASAAETPEATPTSTSTPTPTPSPTASPTASPTPAASPTPVPIAAGTEFAALHAELEDRFGEAEPRSARTVGPIIGADLIRSSVILIIIGELFILGYLWLRFGFRFGTAAIVALLHDVILVVGVFAILGYFFNVEFDALFVTALLTIIGFSVHDTIVVFDRIRENRVRHAGEPFGAIVNHSILQTAGRSIITSLTVIVPLAALVIIGPPTIATFSLALLLGILAGTYSSIFNAAQILAAWADWDTRRKARTR
jgi:preprotein translocase SecF subunit